MDSKVGERQSVQKTLSVDLLKTKKGGNTQCFLVGDQARAGSFRRPIQLSDLNDRYLERHIRREF